MFLDTELTVWTSPERMEGFTVTWYFDKAFTASITMDYDANKDGVFNKRETQEVYNNAFINLEHYDYFTYIFWEGEEYIPSEVENFAVRLENNRLVYEFFIPFLIPYEGTPVNLRVAVYDKTFFCDVAYVDKETVRLEGSDRFHLDYSINRNKDLAIEYDNTYIGNGRDGEKYTGTAHPMEMRIRLEKIN